MKKFFLSLLFVATGCLGYADRVYYTADDVTVFPNPERGFTEEHNKVVTVEKPYILKGNENWFNAVEGGERANMRLIVLLYDFKRFKDVELPEEILNAIDTDMQVLRDKGFKCVLRFAYTESESDIVDATPDWVEKHLHQLKPHLESNADVIYVLEAGFVGVWGEWYYSQNYGNETQHLNENRRRVIDTLLTTMPKDRFVLFRYPMIKNEYFGDKTPLSSDEAFTGTDRARMGHHNDAFLNSWGDMGTYASDDKSDDPEMRQFIASETLYTPNGGETNIERTSDAESRATYEKTITACSAYHWSFCGSSYAKAATGKWRREGTFEEMNRKLGYRYQLMDAIFSESAAPGGKANISIRLRNTGFAPLYNERPVYIVLRNNDNSYPIRLTTDPRRWLPNYETTTISEQIEIASDIPAGTYHLYLHMPDAYSSIAKDPRFAVRFANEDVWDAETGMNDLKADIVISSEASSDPGALPDYTALENTAIAGDGNAYDVLGRRIDENTFHGLYIKSGRKFVR